MNPARLATIALLAVPGLAHASPGKDVMGLVNDTIDGMADGPKTLASDAIVIGIRGNIFDYGTGNRISGANDGRALDFKTHGRLWPMIMDKADPAASKRTLGGVTTVFDTAMHTAWFQASLDVVPTKGAAQTFHVSGVATADDAGAWSIRVFQAGATVADSALPVVLATWDHTGWASTTGTQDAAIIGWFKHHTFAKNAASDALAGGSAPTELADGAAAVKLAAAFDKLANLRAIEIRTTDTSLVATGTALWLNKTERDGEPEFGFAIYAVKENGDWKWRSLQFFSDQ
jgi:hypothetical protein